MGPLIAAVASGFAAGFASGVFPLINAEIIALAYAGWADQPAALAAVAALAAGQTAGKVVVYEAARSGRALTGWLGRWMARRRAAALALAADGAGSVPQPDAGAGVGGLTPPDADAGADSVAGADAGADSVFDDDDDDAADAGAMAGKPSVALAGLKAQKRQSWPRRLWAWLHRVSARLLALMDGRWAGRGIILLSASVGLPPLLATSVLAGIIKMPRADFIVCCLIGRLARFGAIAWPVLILAN